MNNLFNFNFNERERAEVIRPSSPYEAGVADIVQGLFFAYGRQGLKWDQIKEAIGDQVPMEELLTILRSESFYARMVRRGIPWLEGWTPEDNDREILRNQLSPQQAMALMAMTNPTDKRTAKAKLSAVGVTYNTWRTWLANPYFADLVKDTAEKMLQDNIATVHARLVGKAEAGDVSAIKLFYELSGRHDPQRQQMLDIQKVLELILESLQRHITEPRILLAVTQDMDRIMNGKELKQLDNVPANYVDEDVVDADVVESDEVFEPPTIPEGFFDLKEG